MNVIGNLCSDTVDPASRETKVALLGVEGSANALLGYLSEEEGDMAVLTCGALQNLCSNREWCQLVVSEQGLLKLSALIEAEDSRMRRYADWPTPRWSSVRPRARGTALCGAASAGTSILFCSV